MPPAMMAVLVPGETVTLASTNGARVMLLGGEKLPGERFIEWNFVASSRERIEAAKAAWTSQEMGHVPGETEWIPLPEKKPAETNTAATPPPSPLAFRRRRPWERPNNRRERRQVVRSRLVGVPVLRRRKQEPTQGA